MIKLKSLIKENCECGGGCCSTKEQINEKKEFKGNLQMIASMNKKKHDSTVARIEVADRLPHKSMSEVYTHIYKLELNLNYPRDLRKVRDLADKNLFKLVKGMVSNSDEVIKALK
jgi:hypothetical protein